MPEEKTSPTRPIPESYWVIPGQFLAGEYPGAAYLPELMQKRISSFIAAGFNTFFDLTHPNETEPYETILQTAALNHQLQVQYQRLPIGDFDLPSPAEMTATLNAIDTALTAGRKIYVHCHGGIGRTGTVVGCYLVRHGYSGAAALDQLANWWQNVPKARQYPHSPETPQQEQFVRDWAQHENPTT